MIGITRFDCFVVEILLVSLLIEKDSDEMPFLIPFDIHFFSISASFSATSLAHFPVNGFLTISLKYSFQELLRVIVQYSYFLMTLW